MTDVFRTVIFKTRSFPLTQTTFTNTTFTETTGEFFRSFKMPDVVRLNFSIPLASRCVLVCLCFHPHFKSRAYPVLIDRIESVTLLGWCESQLNCRSVLSSVE